MEILLPAIARENDIDIRLVFQNVPADAWTPVAAISLIQHLSKNQLDHQVSYE
jgi:hypothetical protein